MKSCLQDGYVSLIINVFLRYKISLHVLGPQMWMWVQMGWYHISCPSPQGGEFMLRKRRRGKERMLMCKWDGLAVWWMLLYWDWRVVRGYLGSHWWVRAESILIGRIVADGSVNIIPQSRFSIPMNNYWCIPNYRPLFTVLSINGLIFCSSSYHHVL